LSFQYHGRLLVVMPNGYGVSMNGKPDASGIRAVGALPPKQRQVIVRHALEGDSHERIAADFGMSAGAIRQLVHRARRTVREAAAGLLRRGFPVLRLNLRGGAKSNPRSTSHYHLGRSEDLAQALSDLPEALTGPGVLVAGWSLGGALAIHLLARHAGAPGVPPLLGGAAICPPLQPELAHATIDANPVFGRLLLALYRREVLAVRQARDLPPPLREAARHAATVREFEATVTAPRFGYPSYEVFAEVNRPAAALPRLRVPLLLLMAKDDPLVPPDSLDGIPWADCPAVTPLLAAGGGHCGFYDLGRRESLSVRAIGAFFEGIADQAAGTQRSSASAAYSQGAASSASSMAQQAASTAAA
jgi:predicted alpha/beta-fold hydrolase